jgi:ribonucleoside-diphosphate reductase alpha chain
MSVMFDSTDPSGSHVHDEGVLRVPLAPVRETVHGILVDRTRDGLLTDFGRAMLRSDYMLPGESFQDRFAAVARAYGDDLLHAQRIYDYISRLWFMPATPVLSNGGTTRGLPISCFLNETEDKLSSIKGLWDENIELASKGGGIGSYWGNLRSIGEKVGMNGKTSGIMPFIKVMDSMTLAISQGSLRRGSAATYLPVSHPEIEEFIEMRRATGGDPNRKSLNLNHGVVIPDAFMRAVEADADWDLTSPKDGEVIRTVKARDIWIRLLIARVETGEPYLLFIDHVNRAIPEHHRRSGLKVKTSNLCVEITLPTGIDHHGQMRTAVCCLSSLNLETWLDWKDEPLFIEDVMRFLDNVLQDFIDRAPSERRRVEAEFLAPLMEELRGSIGEGPELDAVGAALRTACSKHFTGLMDNAIYAASRERSVGLGVMGFHSFLQAKGVPFEGAVAKMWNKRIFSHIKKNADAASRTLAEQKGACPDAAEHGIMERFSNKTSIAPTASISVIGGQASAGIEPIIANAYNEKRKNGSFEVRNKSLAVVLERHGRNNEATWSSIMTSEGSVQHLDFLSTQEKSVFKTAFEIDQRWIIEHAADRTPLIDQSQSVNVFLPGNVHKKVLHDVHFDAWKKGVKSLYYCRSLAVHRAQKVSAGSGMAGSVTGAKKQAPVALVQEATAYEVCESCQ